MASRMVDKTRSSSRLELMAKNDWLISSSSRFLCFRASFSLISCRFSDSRRLAFSVLVADDRLPGGVLDVVMGGKSGFEMCRQLKADKTTETIPVIICSSKSTEADKMWGDVVGADAYLSKPVDRDEFVSKVRELIAK